MKKQFVTLALAGLLTGLCTSSSYAQVTDEQFKTLMDRYLSTPEGRSRIGKSLQELQQEMQERAETEQFEKAFKEKVKVDIGSSPVRGPQNAKITIVEFSDFQCPYCAKGRTTVDELMKLYPNDVKVAFKNLPLPFHKQARPAAMAALAAHNQGKFWEFHDKLFSNQDKLGDAFYEQTAKELGLNMEKFKADLNSAELSKRIEEESKVAEEVKIQGTPGFVVNGVLVKGAYPVEYFKKIIDRLLKG